MKNHNQNGLWKWYYENGNLEKETNWKDGVRIESKCWDQAGDEINCD